MCADLDAFVELPYAIVERDLRGIAVAVEPERRHQVGADEIRLRPARELEHPATEREYASLLVGDDKARPRGGVVVLLQLEEEAEAAVVAGDRLVVKAFQAVGVDRPLLAVRADEVRHGLRLATGMRVDARHPTVQRRVVAQRLVVDEDVMEDLVVAGRAAEARV